MAVILLPASIFGDAAAYIAISRGVIKGDAALVIVFAAVPVLGVICLLARGIRPGKVATADQVA